MGVAGSIEVTESVVFGRAAIGAPTPGTCELLLDLYRTAAPHTGLQPAVVLLHGGGFRTLDRRHPPVVAIARGLAERGVVVASIDYRLLPQQPVPSGRVATLAAALPDVPIFRVMATAAEDTITALDHLRARADELRIDAGRIGLIGSSAGAITANHVAYALDDHGVEAPDVAFVASLWGAMFVPAPAPSAAEPADQIGPGDPALFAVHGDADTTVSVEHSDALVRGAGAAGVPVEYHRIPGGGHGYEQSGFFAADLGGGTTPFARLLDRTAEVLAAAS